MMNADADLGVREGRSCFAAHPVADRPVRLAVDLGVPLIVHGTGRVPAGEPDRKGVTPGGDLQVTHDAGQRVPVQIPDRDVDPARDLNVTAADLAQVAVAE